ncbi:hypothetical protein EG329_000102 [Mollisiaceae sp. DMI_Dod_QoI]|nr:hypothetical protein EG329_000102 [Helotiales sp. DMI_Dod_QoI]
MDQPPPYVPHEPIGNHDLETASIRSAAPSYTSDAPTYVSTIPPAPSTRIGLPPIPPLPDPRPNSNPSLDAFRMSSWSRTQSSNPTARHYHSIAQRRAAALTIQEQSSLLIAALHGDEGIARIKKKIQREERAKNIRTNEDPYLVGEQAAEENRQERLKRENGWGVLEKEDKRWDWLIAQMSDWEERDKSWKKFRKEVEGAKRGKLAKRLGLRGL